MTVAQDIPVENRGNSGGNIEYCIQDTKGWDPLCLELLSPGNDGLILSMLSSLLWLLVL